MCYYVINWSLSRSRIVAAAGQCPCLPHNEGAKAACGRKQQDKLKFEA